MRLRAFVMLGLAVVLGATAVFLARNWIQTQMAAQKPVEVVQQQAPQIELTKVVVARVPLRFGNRINQEHIKEVDWPATALPPGVFTSVEELLGEEQRVVLHAMEANEPILASKVTGGGERASLSALIEPGMRAVTIRVNDILGVAGFVLPGDRVDIMLTRDLEGQPITDVLLQNVKVLGIDQDANEKREAVGVVKSVTLEVDTAQAQKLTLATKVGQLSLTLRNVTNVATETVQRVSIEDLNVGEAIAADGPGEATVETAPPPREVARTDRPENIVEIDPLSRIGITRGTVRREYQVNPEDEEEIGGPTRLTPTQPLAILPDTMIQPRSVPSPVPVSPARVEPSAGAIEQDVTPEADQFSGPRQVEGGVLPENN